MKPKEQIYFEFPATLCSVVNSVLIDYIFIFTSYSVFICLRMWRDSLNSVCCSAAVPRAPQMQCLESGASPSVGMHRRQQRQSVTAEEYWQHDRIMIYMLQLSKAVTLLHIYTLWLLRRQVQVDNRKFSLATVFIEYLKISQTKF